MKKFLSIEKEIMKFVKSHYLIFGAIIITILALAIRYYELDYESPDYIYFLQKWFDYLKNNGGLKALSSYPGDYNAPYVTIMALLTYIPIRGLYLIKFVSIIFDFILAISCAKLVSYIVPKSKKEYALLTYFAILFLPEVAINSALWAQCDSGYTAFIVLALLYLLKDKYIHSLIFLGIAFALKLQFIFILPIFIVLYISKNKFSILHFLIIPIVNFILCLPAVIMGKPIKDIMLVYFNQPKTYSALLSANTPNLYSLLKGTPYIFYRFGIILTIAIFAAMTGYIVYKKVKWNNEKILTLALWFILIAIFFLPGMHDRYLYMGEILSVICLIAYKKNPYLVLFLVTNAIIVYSKFLFKVDLISYTYTTIIFIIVLALFTKNTIKTISE